MKIGCCASLKDIDELVCHGYDYIEIPAYELLESNVSRQAVSAVNSFFPSGASLYQDDWSSLVDWSRSVIEKAVQHDIQVITFGSGAARQTKGNVPNNRERTRWKQFMQYVDEAISKTTVQFALEPLAATETNFLNTLQDAVDSIRNLGLKHIGVTIDSFHLWHGDRKVDFDRFEDLIVHVHLADHMQSVPKDPTEYLNMFLSFADRHNLLVSMETVPYNKRDLLAFDFRVWK